MGARHHRIGIKPVIQRPGTPDTGHSGGRVDEHSVHVKEKSATSNLRHRLRALQSFLATSETVARGTGVFLYHGAFPAVSRSTSELSMTEQFTFSDLRELFAKANEEKSGDQLAGIAARSERERVAAKRRLADLTLDEIVRQPLIDPSKDDVSRLILETLDDGTFRSISSLTL